METIIGISDTRPGSYAELMNLINKKGSGLVNTVSMKGEVRAVVVDVPLGAVSSFVTEAQVSGLARYIEPNFKVEATFVPNDPYWNLQWGPKKIEADWAWNTTTGNHSVLVAVVDTGIDYDHPDLAANYVPLGYDWVNNNPYPMDDEGHGTHCAGIIAAVINNIRGIAGLAQVRIMAEKVLNSMGEGYADWVANGIRHAVDQGADIISMSLGGYFPDETMYEAVRDAYDAGVLLVAAAGNDAWRAKTYPAAYDEVIAVTATDESDNPSYSWYSDGEYRGGTNFGDWVEVAAPGTNIYSTIWDNSYAYGNGTSMACPHVAGVAALIWSRFPNMTHEQVRAQLRLTGVDLGASNFDEYYGYGRINASEAVKQAPTDHDLLILHHKTPPYLEPGNQTLINTTVLNFGKSNESNIKVQLLINGTIVDSKSISFLASGKSTTVNLSWTPTVKGVYNVTSYVARQGSQLEPLWVDNNGTGTWTQWSKSGSDYLKTEGGGYIYLTGGSPAGKQEGWFTFQNHTASGTINSVVLKLRAKVDYDPTEAMPIRVYLHDGTSETDLGTFTPATTTYAYFSFTLTTVLNTWDKIDKAKIRVKNDAVIFENHYIDAAKLEVTYTGMLRDINMKYNALSAYVRVGISRTIKVPKDYVTIQWAVDASFPGDIIQVDKKPTPYYENVIVDKPHIKIVGKDPKTTIIDGNGTGDVITIGEENVEINNFTIQNGYEYGIYSLRSGTTIVGNTITNNTWHWDRTGIYLIGTDYNKITNNTIVSNYIGIFMLYSSSSFISGNTVENNLGYGIDLIYFCSNNDISDNTITSNGWNGIIVAVGCNGNTIKGNNLTLNGYYGEQTQPDEWSAIYIGYSDYNIAENNDIINNKWSIQLFGELRFNAIRNNKIKNNDEGIQLTGNYYWYSGKLYEEYPTDNIVKNNKIINNSYAGIRLDGENNAVYENEIVNNTYGICVYPRARYNKIGLYVSEKKDIIGNEIKNNHIGIELYASDNNSVTANKIKNNYYGIKLTRISAQDDYPTDNKIYWNNFVDNTVQVYRNYTEIKNRWTHHWGVEGNYWSDYRGEDTNRTKCSIGIGDTLLPHPYPNSSDPQYGVDWHPLMKPYIPGDINHDGAVDIYDLTKMALAWNSTPGDANWDAHADLNEDGRVYEEDLDILSNHWLEGSSVQSMDFETAWKLVKRLYGIP